METIEVFPDKNVKIECGPGATLEVKQGHGNVYIAGKTIPVATGVVIPVSNQTSSSKTTMTTIQTTR